LEAGTPPGHRRGNRAQRGLTRIQTLWANDLAIRLGSILRMRLPGSGGNGYHRRSRVETKVHCVKLLGQRLLVRDFDRQLAAFRVRVAVVTGYTALGTPPTQVVG